MGKFNWWRRYSKKPKLSKKDAFKGKTFLLQQIEHGDYDHSDYLRQAHEEINRMIVDMDKITINHKGGPDSLKDKHSECERKFRKRHNKLLEDYQAEETRTLHNLQQALFKEFGVDVWAECLDTNTNSAVEFFHMYKKLAAEQVALSKKN